MATSNMKTGGEPIPDRSFISDTHQTMDSVQHNIDIMN
jgi:hypothetical protein